MTLVFGDAETIADDRREVAHNEAEEMMVDALDILRDRVGLDSKTIGYNIASIVNEWAFSVINFSKIEDGFNEACKDIWHIEEIGNEYQRQQEASQTSESK